MSVIVKAYFYQQGKCIKKIGFSKGQTYAVTIGKKGSNADVKLESKHISRNHAQLIFTETGELYLVDLNSTNGTFFKGERLSPNRQVKLVLNDEFQLTESGFFYVKIVAPDYVEKAHHLSSPHKERNILDKFNGKQTIYIGRGSENDVVLDDHSVSRKHCAIESRGGNQYQIKDLGSLNGTFINGKKVKGTEVLKKNDQIHIGHYLISLKGEIRNLGNEVAIRLESISKTYPNGYVGLNPTSLEIPSKSLLAIMGPSGCGKSTLLKALNGEAPVSGGKVYLFEQELVRNFEYLKTQIGYVPQDDIVHGALTVEQSIYYAAKLRLDQPPDEIIQEKMEQLLIDLNIRHIRHHQVSKISGGQRKRVSIAVELLTDPLILFLDEPTSPLDPQTIEEFLGILKTLADEGTTVVMVTHKPEDLEYMDQVVFMAEGGHVVYFGDAKTYQSYFGVNKPVKVYAEIAGDNSKKWIDKFKSEHPLKKVAQPTKDIRKNFSVNGYAQWYWLSKRYFQIKLNDRSNSLVLVGQAPIIAALICLIFDSVTLAIPFLLAISAIWFGVNNAAREIVSELPIYKRERSFNQLLLPYIFSKLSVLTIFSVIQCALFVGIISVYYQNTTPLQWNDPFGSFLWMLGISVASSLLGLFLSATASTTEKVMTLVPITLIPQIILAGFITKITSPAVEVLSYITLSRWGTEGFSSLQDSIMIPVPACPDPLTSNLPESDPGEQAANAIEVLKSSFHEETYHSIFTEELAGTMNLDFFVITLMSLLFFVGVVLALKKKDTITKNK